MTQRSASISIILFGLLTGLVGVVVARSMAPTFETLATISISRQAPTPTTDFQYEGYYGLQANELYGKTVMSWFVAAPDLRELMSQAGQTVSDQELIDLARKFSVRQFSAQQILVTFNAKDEARVRAVSAAIAPFVTARTAKETGADGQASYRVIISEPTVVAKRIAWWLAGGVGAAAGWLLAAVVIAARRNWQAVD